jgi:murein DD-endopeptidase MepM/ murein hydrolase activator NlpD
MGDGRRRGSERGAGPAARLGRLTGVLLACALTLAPAPAAASVRDAGWTWPLGEGAPVAVARSFDPPTTRYGTGHRGVDLAGAPGSTVRAAGAGRVSYAGLLAGRGVVVVVHGELRTTYEPVRAEVAVGQEVSVGEPLGRLDAGHAGCSVAACLHWGLRRGEQYLDPLRLVGRGPVRLLPLGGAGDQAAAPTLGGREQSGTSAGGPQRAAAGPNPPHRTGRSDESAPTTRVVARERAVAGLLALALLVLAVLTGRRRPRPSPRPGGGAEAQPAHLGTRPERCSPQGPGLA